MNEACRLTPAGLAGLTVFRLHGPATADFLASCFLDGRPRPQDGGLRFGRLTHGGEVIDEAVVRFTPDVSTAEVSVHGGRAVERRLVAALEAGGFVLAAEAPSRSDQRAPLLRAEATAALEAATSVQAVLFFLEVLEGGLERELLGMSRVLTEIRSGGHHDVVMRLGTLIGRSEFGRSFSDPPRVVLSGKPNSGKSSLFNSLCRVERVITAPEPGTTRDVVAAAVTLEGYPFVLHDTAGLRTAAHPVEMEGIARARRIVADGEIVCRLVRADEVAADSAPASPDGITILSQIDRVSSNRRTVLSREWPGAIAVSSTTGEGVDDLCRSIIGASAFRGPAVREFPCPFTDRQISCLARARQALPDRPEDALKAIRAVLSGE